MATQEVTRTDARVEALLNSPEYKGIKWRFEPAYDLDQINLAEQKYQLRKPTQRATQSIIEQFSEHMKAGAAFPPIVTTPDGVLVDGFGRVPAADAAGLESLPAYVVEQDDEDLLRTLGAAANQMNGRRLDKDEMFDAAKLMIAEGFGDEVIMRQLGCSASTVGNWRREIRFAEAVERTGIEVPEMTKVMRRTLGGINLDEPFKVAVQAVVQSRPSPKRAHELVLRANKATTERQAVQDVQDAYAEWGTPEAKAEPKRWSNTNTAATLAFRRVQSLLAIEEQPETLADPALREVHEPKVREAYEFLGRWLAAYDA